MFEPNTREEISGIRKFLKEELGDSYEDKSRIWLGFVRPHYQNGQGRYSKYTWIGEWAPGGYVNMNQSLFRNDNKDRREPNDLGGEYCTQSWEDKFEKESKVDKVFDVRCNCRAQDPSAYAVCELETGTPTKKLRSVYLDLDPTYSYYTQ